MFEGPARRLDTIKIPPPPSEFIWDCSIGANNLAKSCNAAAARVKLAWGAASLNMSYFLFAMTNASVSLFNPRDVIWFCVMNDVERRCRSLDERYNRFCWFPVLYSPISKSFKTNVKCLSESFFLHRFAKYPRVALKRLAFLGSEKLDKPPAAQWHDLHSAEINDSPAEYQLSFCHFLHTERILSNEVYRDMYAAGDWFRVKCGSPLCASYNSTSLRSHFAICSSFSPCLTFSVCLSLCPSFTWSISELTEWHLYFGNWWRNEHLRDWDSRKILFVQLKKKKKIHYFKWSHSIMKLFLVELSMKELLLYQIAWTGPVTSFRPLEWFLNDNMRLSVTEVWSGHCYLVFPDAPYTCRWDKLYGCLYSWSLGL